MAEPKFTLESLVNILPTFEGKKTENIENYLMLFEQLIQEVELTENLKILILKSKLNGIARDFISQDDDLAKITNYEDFKTKLKKLFKHSKTLESIQDDFMNLSQKPTQTIAEYSRIFDLAARKYLNKCGCQDQPGAIEFLNSLKLTKFLSSIKPDISLEVRKMGPKTFEDARLISLKIESAFNSIPSEAINANKTNDSDLCKMLMEMTMTQNNKIKDLENKIEQKFNSDIPKQNTNNIMANLFCDICLNESHATKFCRYNAKSANFRQTTPIQENHHIKKNSKISKVQEYKQVSEVKPEMPYTEIVANVQEKFDGRLPIIHLNINNINFNALVDSGSSISILGVQLFNRLQQTDIKFNFISRQVKLRAFNNTPILFQKCVKITFKIHKIFTTGTFYITDQNFDKNYDMLLGYDYLRTNKMLLDCDKRTLQFKNTEIPLIYTEETNPMVNNVTDTSINEELQNIVGKGTQNGEKQHQSIIQNETPKQHYNAQAAIHLENYNIEEKLFGLFQNKENSQEEDQQQNKIIARNQQNFMLKPRETKLIQIKHDSINEKNKIILFEPITNVSYIKMEYSIHNINLNNNITVRISNQTNSRIKIKKNFKLGEVTTKFNIQQNNIHDKDHLEILDINSLSVEETQKLRVKELKREDFVVTHLSEDYQHKFLNLLMNNAYAFSKSYETIGKSTLVTPKFNLLHPYPIQTKPYPIPHNLKKAAKQEIDNLLKANIIERSDSAYAFPVVFVQKKPAKTENQNNIKIRLATDYRLLNEVLQSMPYPIPSSKAILQSMSGKKYYTVLDFHSAFFQIYLREQDRDKLAFITEYGAFRPLRLNFGSSISSQNFAKLIDMVLGKFDKTKVRYFIDDVILATDTIEEMLTLLQEVLAELVKHNLTIEPSKLQLCKTEIEFLGFTLNEKGYSPSEKNIKKIQSLARPKTKRGVKSLLGLTNYFRHLIKNYAEIVAPLVNLTKEKQKFAWNAEVEQAFNTIQKAIVQNPTLTPPDFEKEFILITDCSKIACSGILIQEHDGVLKPIEFFGRKLKETEQRYPSMKLEMLALHESIQYFKNFLKGRRFKILTDSKALTQHVDISRQSDLVARWVLNISEYDFSIHHIKGEINPSDYISRHINAIDCVPNQQNTSEDIFKVDMEISDDNIKIKQLEDEKLASIINKLKSNKHYKKLKKFEIWNDLLVLKRKETDISDPLIIVPNSLKNRIIENAHKPHFGFNKTYAFIKDRYFWYGMYQNVKKACANCIKCNISKPHKTLQYPVQEMEKNHEIGSALHCDVVGRLPLSQNKNSFIFTILDTFSRYLEAIPMRNIDSKSIINVLNNYFARFGICKEIHLDNGTYFKSKIFTQYLENLNIKPHFSSVYRPASNGLVEVAHKLMKTSLTTIGNDTYYWEDRLLFYKLHYNNSRHRSTGYEPSKLFFGRKLTTPFSAHTKIKDVERDNYLTNLFDHMTKVKENALENQKKIMEEYNRNKNIPEPKELKLGQTVYLKSFTKPLALQNKYFGPFRIVKLLRNRNVVVENVQDNKTIKVHADKLYTSKYMDEIPK